MAVRRGAKAIRQAEPAALRIAARLREARLKAKMTQQQLAGERYTKAYISALENGLVKPSVAALDYLAGRLGTTASWMLADEPRQWNRLDADLQLASGNWQGAADAYRGLLQSTTDRGSRAELLRNLAEALVRLDRGPEAAAAASEAVEIFEAQGRAEDAALASYWLAGALYAQENQAEARAIVQAVLGRVRAGLRVEPAFKLRLLMALATNEARDGNHALALTYLEEIRSLADLLDDRRRATFYFDLAYSYRATGDYEAAIRAGHMSLALFTAASADAEMALTENDLALAHLATGNVARADALAASARHRFEALGDQRMLAHVLETEARIECARNEWRKALELARRSIELAEETGNQKAAISALLTVARAAAGLGDPDQELEAYSNAAQLARSLERSALLRRVLARWAEAIAASGDHQRAFELQREALAL